MVATSQINHSSILAQLRQRQLDEQAEADRKAANKRMFIKNLGKLTGGLAPLVYGATGKISAGEAMGLSLGGAADVLPLAGSLLGPAGSAAGGAISGAVNGGGIQKAGMNATNPGAVSGLGMSASGGGTSDGSMATPQAQAYTPPAQAGGSFWNQGNMLGLGQMLGSAIGGMASNTEIDLAPGINTMMRGQQQQQLNAYRQATLDQRNQNYEARNQTTSPEVMAAEYQEIQGKFPKGAATYKTPGGATVRLPWDNTESKASGGTPQVRASGLSMDETLSREVTDLRGLNAGSNQRVAAGNDAQAVEYWNRTNATGIAGQDNNKLDVISKVRAATERGNPTKIIDGKVYEQIKGEWYVL